jgi:hypothetical protein
MAEPNRDIRPPMPSDGEGGTMITSPCRNCRNVGLPKDECLTHCKLIQHLQSILISTGCTPNYTAVDCAEDNRFSICLPQRLQVGLA